MGATDSESYDVIVIGAGAAGLACVQKLCEYGYKVICLEARDRIGGRILTIDEPHLHLPIELGAEFVHGVPSSVFDGLNMTRRMFIDVSDIHHERRGVHRPRFRKMNDFRAVISRSLSHAKLRGADRSVREYLESGTRRFDGRVKRLVEAYIEGFHAADLEEMSLQGLTDAESAPLGTLSLNGISMFRPFGGYFGLLEELYPKRTDVSSVFRFQRIVQKIEWSSAGAWIFCQSPSHEVFGPLRARCVVVTVPLGVLRDKTSAAHIQFEPKLRGMDDLWDGLRMGHVQRIVFCFSSRFWEDLTSEPLAFFHAGSEFSFPTWWTQQPLRAPILVAWQGGPRALEMSSWPEQRRVEEALLSLSRWTGKSLAFLRAELLDHYTHNWSADAYSAGAYSYVAVDGERRFQKFERQYQNTVWFAGEACAGGAGRGTVHGAIQSGLRTAHHLHRLL